MRDESDGSSTEKEGRTEIPEGTRPQQGGEAATTRFGMEDGDNTDVPATGGPAGEGDGWKTEE